MKFMKLAKSWCHKFYMKKKKNLCKILSVAEQTDLSLSWSQTPKTGFLVMRLISEPIQWSVATF